MDKVIGIYATATGTLLDNPVLRDSVKGQFVTFRMKCPRKESFIYLQGVSYSPQINAWLLVQEKDKGIQVRGEIYLKPYLGKDGQEKTSLTIELK